jgi:hypothetical protein
MRIITDHIRAIKALAGTSMDSLNHAMLRSSYENAINLACVLHSSKNLTDQFDVVVTKNEDLMLECDAPIAKHHVLTGQVMQLEAQLMQTLAPGTAATIVSPAGRKGQTDPEKFSIYDSGKLRSFGALLLLHLIYQPGEFPIE